MEVAVTGAAGHIGRWVVRELAGAGHGVRALDRRTAPEVPGLQVLDLADAVTTLEALRGVEALIHLAAVPGPRQPEWEAFDPNLVTSYHVLEAARVHGIARVVLASSIWAYGYNPPAAERLPQTVPLSEEAVVPTLNGYGLSKRLLEHMGEAFAGRTGAQVVCMRLPWVAAPHQYPAAGAALGDDGALAARAELWSYVDVRDVAIACRLAVEQTSLGFQILNIGAADTRSLLPSAELLRRYAPGAMVARPPVGHEALYSIERARRVLGYAPRFSWRREGAEG